MKVRTLAAIASGLLIANIVNADVPLPEPDLTFYGSVTLDGVLLEPSDPQTTQYRIRSEFEGVTLSTYRMFTNEQAVIDGVSQYKLTIPMEFVPGSAVPSADAVRLGDSFTIHVESCTNDCDNGDESWTTHYSVASGTSGRGVVVQMDLDNMEDTCPADFDRSGLVDTSDLLALLAAWGTNGTGANLSAPLDVVDTADLLALLAAWGDCL